MTFVQESILIFTATTSALAVLFAVMAWLFGGRQSDPATTQRISALEVSLDRLPAILREESGAQRREAAEQASALRQELATLVASLGGGLGERMTAFGEGVKTSTDQLATTQRDRLGETNTAMKELRERTESAVKTLTERLDALIKDQGERHEAFREQVRGHLDTLREGNEKKLDEMKGVVDEKLSATLSERLDSSFKTVSDRLEAVHKGLGEMQGLAVGVGDLKRVLTNVKARGAWGEVRLGQLLEDILPGQFEAQVQVRSGAGERVDYAIKLPGRSDDGSPLWLPIDCKFPQEDYDRLLVAHDQADAGQVEICAAALERAVRIQAKSIAAKYVHPPQTTPFAILYLPTEGLYAEVARRPGLIADLQSGLSVMITGPSTLPANLLSLQMGFRSLVVEKRSADVWKVLGEAKTEFAKYGETWGKLGEKLDQARDLHEKVAVRTRAVDRKLRGVEALEPSTAPALAALMDDDDEILDAAE